MIKAGHHPMPTHPHTIEAAGMLSELLVPATNTLSEKPDAAALAVPDDTCRWLRDQADRAGRAQFLPVGTVRSAWQQWEEKYQFSVAELEPVAIGDSSNPIAIRSLAHLNAAARRLAMLSRGWTQRQLDLLTALSNEHYFLSQFICGRTSEEIGAVMRQIISANLLSDTLILRGLVYGEFHVAVDGFSFRTKFGKQLVEHVVKHSDKVWCSILLDAADIDPMLRPLFADILSLRRRPARNENQLGDLNALEVHGVLRAHVDESSATPYEIDGLLSEAIALTQGESLPDRNTALRRLAESSTAAE